MVDWERYGRLLLAGTETAALRFFAESPNYDLAAFGYTFELANASPAFNLVLNSRAFLGQTREEYRIHSPDFSVDDLRWSSGDFEHCSAAMSQILLEPVEWEVAYVHLHDLSCRGTDSFSEIYDGLVRISCQTLATLAMRGVFGDWRRIDFNVGEYGDEIKVIKHRHRTIVEMINAQIGK